MQITPLSAQGLALADSRPRGKSTVFGVQALRFLAAVLVVILHALNQEITFKAHPLPSQQWMQGGVDIFFVISGFLITSLIVRSRQAGDFSFADFYARRIKRIFPALIAVLAACLLAG